MQKLCHIVAVEKSYNPISIDLHTMSSYSPNVVQERYSEAVIETPYSLNEYIQLYKNAHKKESRSFLLEMHTMVYLHLKYYWNLYLMNFNKLVLRWSMINLIFLPSI